MDFDVETEENGVTAYLTNPSNENSSDNLIQISDLIEKANTKLLDEFNSVANEDSEFYNNDQPKPSENLLSQFDSKIEDYYDLECVKIKEDEYFSSEIMEYAMDFINRQATVLVERAEFYSCPKPQCRWSFVTARQRELHLVKHIRKDVIKSTKIQTPLNEKYSKKYFCEQCDAGFVHKSTLSTHTITHKPFPHYCHCKVGFYQKNDLVLHKMLAHGDKKLDMYGEVIDVDEKLAEKNRRKRQRLN